MMRFIGLMLAFLLIGAQPSSAQTMVSTACAALAAPYAAGQTGRPMLVDEYGRLCGGGGGGAVTVADGADVAEGAITDAAASVGGTGTLSAKLRRITTQLDAIQTAVTGATPAGTAIIGKVGIDQTTPGTTNGVQVNAALPAGTNGIGNVGGKTVSVCVTPTVTTSNAYGTNYVVGGKLTFSNLFQAVGTGVLQNVTVTIGKVENNGFTFFPFSSDPSATTWTDAAVAAINATDIPKQRPPISLAANTQLGTATVASAVGIGQGWVAGGTTGYGVLIANAALTNNFSSSSELQVCVTVLQDL